jgi:XTP/dITP diphosphohydrolase
MEIIIGSQNLHKIREIRWFFKIFPKVDLLSLLNFPEFSPQEETLDDIKEVAIAKAVSTAKELNRWVLADDSGLFVPALAGAPGVLSRRYASNEATDGENRQKLLQALKGMEGIRRCAYFECCMALASPEGLKKVVSGQCHGYVAEHEKGRNGFGYDALFIKNDYDKTFAELDDPLKNRISHRGKAFEKLRPLLETLIL